MGPTAKRGFDRGTARGGFFRGRATRGWRGRGRGRGGSFDHRFRRSRSRSPSPRRSRERSSRTHDKRSPTRHHSRPISSEKSYDDGDDKRLSGGGRQNRPRDEVSVHNESREQSLPTKSVSPPKPSTPSLIIRHQPIQTNPYYGAPSGKVFNLDHQVQGGQVMPPIVSDIQQQSLPPPIGKQSQINSSVSGARYSLPMMDVDEDPRLMQNQKPFQQKEFKDAESLRITVDNDHYKNEKPSALERLGPPVESHQQRSYVPQRNKDSNTANQMDNSRRGSRYDEKKRKKHDYQSQSQSSSNRSSRSSSSRSSSSSSSSSSSRSPSPDRGSRTKKHSVIASRHSMKAKESMQYPQKKSHAEGKNDPRLRVTNLGVTEIPNKIESRDPHASTLSSMLRINQGSESSHNSVQKLLNDLSHLGYSSLNVNKIKEEPKSLTETLRAAAGLAGPSTRPAKSILKRSTNPTPSLSQLEPDKQIKSILKNKPTITAQEPELSAYSNIFSRNLEGSLPGLDLLDESPGENLKSNTGRFGFPSIDDEEEFLYGDDETENEQYKPEEPYDTTESTTTNYQSAVKETDERYVPQLNPSTIDLEKEESQVTNQPDFQNTQVQRILSAIGFDFDLAKKIQRQKGSVEASPPKEETCEEPVYIKADAVKQESQQADTTKDVQFGMFDQSASFLSSGFDGDLNTLMTVEGADKMHKANDNQTTLKAADHNNQNNSSGIGVPTTTALNYNYPHRHPAPPIQYVNYPNFPSQEPSYDFRYPAGIVHPPIHGYPPVDMQHMQHGLPQTSTHPPHLGHPPQFPWRQQFPYNEYPSNYEYQQQQQQQVYRGVAPYLEDNRNIEPRGRPHEKSRKHKRKSKREMSSEDNEDDNGDRRKRQKYRSDDSGSEDERNKISKKAKDRPIGDIEKETNRRLGLVTKRPAVVSTEYLSSDDEQETVNETKGSVGTDFSDKAKNIQLDEDDERHAKKQAVLEVKEKFEEIAKHRPVTRKELEDEIKKKTIEIYKRKKESAAKNEEIAEKRKRIQGEKEIYLRRMEMLEEELCRLRKQQSNLIRKRNFRRDEKDPVLMENTMLQDAIASQIQQLRKDYTEKKKNENAKEQKNDNRSISGSPERESFKLKRLQSSEQNYPDRKRPSRGHNERNSMSPQKQEIVAKSDRSRESKDSRRSSRDSPKRQQKSSPKRGNSREDRRRNRSVEGREKNLVEDRRYEGKKSKLEERNKQQEERSKKQEEGSKPKEKFQFEFSYFDPGSHFCKVCKMSLARLNEVFIHLHSKKHLQKCDPFDRPWMSDMNSNPPPSSSSSKRVAAPLKGVDFMMAVNGFYCKLCKQFFGDAACSAEHLKSVGHNKAYQKYIDENPLYEKELELMRAAALGNQEDEKLDQASIKVIKKDGGFGKFAFKNEDCMKDVKQENSSKKAVTDTPIYEGPKLPPELQVRKSVDIFQTQKFSSAGKRYGEKNQELYLPGEGDIAAAFSGKLTDQTDNNTHKPETSESLSSKSLGSIDSVITSPPLASNIPKPAFIGRMPGRKIVSRGRGRAKAETRPIEKATTNEKHKEAQQMAHIAKEMQAHMARAQLAAKQQLEKVQKDEALVKSLKVAKEKAMLQATKLAQRPIEINQGEKTKPVVVTPVKPVAVAPVKPVAPKDQSAQGVAPKDQSTRGVDPKDQSTQGVDPKEQSMPSPAPKKQSAPGIAPPGMSPHLSPVSSVPEEDLYSIDDMFMDDGTEIPGMDVLMTTSSLGVKVKPPPPVTKTVSQTANSGPKTSLTTSSKESIYGLFFSGK